MGGRINTGVRCNSDCSTSPSRFGLPMTNWTKAGRVHQLSAFYVVLILANRRVELMIARLLVISTCLLMFSLTFSCGPTTPQSRSRQASSPGTAALPTGHYVSTRISSEFFDLRTDNTYYAECSSPAVTGTYRIDGDTLTFQYGGLAQRATVRGASIDVISPPSDSGGFTMFIVRPGSYSKR